MSLRCEHGTMRGLCVVRGCSHWDQLNSDSSAAQSRRHANPEGRSSTYRCGNCGQPGHNRTSCEFPKRHSSFKDMTGQRVARLVVVSEAKPKTNGTVRWNCRCDCGGTCVVEGIQLRALLKSGSRSYGCEACRDKRPGTVTRRSA